MGNASEVCQQLRQGTSTMRKHYRHHWHNPGNDEQLTDMECQEVNVWAGNVAHRVHALEAAIDPLHVERVSAYSAA